MSGLIDVSFEDKTNYISFDGEDVVGMVLPTFWGKEDYLQTYSLTEFLNMYPQSLDISKTSSVKEVPDYLKAWKQVLNAFNAGASTVEILRPKGNSKFMTFSTATVDNERTLQLTPQLNRGLGELNGVVLQGKYPGLFPKSVFPYLGIRIRLIVDTEADITQGEYPCEIQISGITEVGNGENSAEYVETIQGGLDKTQIVDGQYFSIDRVNKSQLFDVVLGDSFTDCDIQKDFLFEPSMYTTYVGDTVTDSEISSFYQSAFSDFETSSSTLLITPWSSQFLYQSISKVASTNMTCTALTGYPVLLEFTYDDIKAYHSSYSVKDKFSTMIAARQYEELLGFKWVSDGTATYAGRIVSVQKDVNTNQLPSAKRWGAFPGVLFETLSFSDVLKLHEQGIGSVYSSSTGPQIFNVRSLHVRQTSYFGKFNVSRVISKLLRPVFEACMQAIHTPVSADKTQREAFRSLLQTIMNRDIAAGNLQSDSEVIISDEDNSDANTNGGEILNIVLSCHFVKLVEKIKIKVTATDSSVQANIE